jgi:hypothetical protein
MLRQVILVPASALTQVADALSEPKIDILSCHLSSMNVFYWLYFANWLHSRRKENLESGNEGHESQKPCLLCSRASAAPIASDGFADWESTSDDSLAGFFLSQSNLRSETHIQDKELQWE